MAITKCALLLCALALVFCCCLPSALADKIWSSCGTPTDTLKLSNITVSPAQPVIGKDFSVRINGTLSDPITGGKAHVTALYQGVKLFEGDIDLCGQFLSCPVAKGPFDRTITQTIPDIAPPGGPYTGRIVLIDQDNKDIACIDYKFEMQEP